VIHNPAEKIMIAEEWQPDDGRWIGRKATDAAANPDFLTTRHAVGQKISGTVFNTQTWGPIKGAECGMCDGHVELISNNQSNDPRFWDPTIK